MAADARQRFDVRVDGHGFAKEPHLAGPVHDAAAQRAHALVAHEQHRAFGPPEIVLEVMAHAARVAHAAGGKNHLGGGVGVDELAFLRAAGDAQVREGERVDAGAQQGEGFLVRALAGVVVKDGGGLDAQRAVHVDGEAVMPVNAALLLDLADEVEHLLRAAHREAGDDHVAAPVEGFLQYAGQRGKIVRHGAVGTVPVGGFHHHQIGGMQVLRVAQEGLTQVADVAGKDDHARLRALGHGHLDGGRSQQVPHVHHADAHARAHLNPLAVVAGPKQPACAQRVLLGVEGLHGRFALTPGLAGFPFGVALLNVGRIQQHDAAQVRRGVGGEDGAAEAPFVQ